MERRRPESDATVQPQEQEDITLEGRHIEITGTYRVLDESGRQEHFEQEVTEEWVEISEDEILDEAAPEQDEAAEEIEDEIESEDYEEESSDETRDAADDDAETIYEEDEEEVAVDPVAAEQRAALRGLAAQEPVHQEPELFAPRPKPPAPPLWTWLAAPLAFLLAIQMVHHSRAILARHPRIGPALVSVYGGPEFANNTARETFVTPNPITEYGFLLLTLDSRAIHANVSRTTAASAVVVSRPRAARP